LDEHRIVLDDLLEDEAMVSSVWTSPREGAEIDAITLEDPEIEESLDDSDHMLAKALFMKAEEGDFKMRIGSTNASGSFILTETSIDEKYDVQSKGCKESEEDEWAKMETEINLVLASATATFASGVSPEHLSKVWSISHEDAKRTIGNTSHLLERPTNAELSRNYGKNDRFTDAKGSGKSKEGPLTTMARPLGYIVTTQ
jgi:hypothetical protein